MKMGEDTSRGCQEDDTSIRVHHILPVSQLHILSFRLGTWTAKSPCPLMRGPRAIGYPFLAIVMHYISNEWQLGKLMFI
jgi:hypothetical protein